MGGLSWVDVFNHYFGGPNGTQRAELSAVSSANQIVAPSCPIPNLAEEAHWYAVHTRCRHERMVDTTLKQSGVVTFLPLVKEIHRWSDRRQPVDVPLFACYMFVYMDVTSSLRLRLLRTPGVIGLVRGPCGAIPIPPSEIERVQRLIAERLPLSPFPFLKVGQRVRVRGGALDGMEGILSSHRGATALVISVDAIQRSISVSIEGYDVEPA